MSEDRFFTIANFELECGVTLPELRIAYRIEGELDAARENVFVTGTSFGASPDNLDYLVGRRRTIDTEKWCAVRTHMIGNGRSSSPSNTPAPFDGPRFPQISIRDNVHAQYRLLTEGLRVRRIRAYIGASMGAQQAYQMAVSYPDFLDLAVAIVGGAHTTGHGYAMLEAWRLALLSDPAFRRGEYTEPPLTGLRMVGTVWAPWGFSQEFYAQERWRTLGFYSLGDFLKATKERFLYRDANNFLCQLSAWQRHNVGDTPGFGGEWQRALRAVKARVLVLPCRTDAYFAVPDLSAEAAMVPQATIKVIDSVYGHQAGFGISTEDAAFISAAVTEAINQE